MLLVSATMLRSLSVTMRQSFSVAAGTPSTRRWGSCSPPARSTCPAKWYFRFAIGLREPPTGTLALGAAFHSVLAANFRQKIESKQDLPVEDQESFCEVFAIAAEGVEFREDEEPAAIETGRALVRRYMADAAPWIGPEAVELPVESVIAGVRVQGIVDLPDMEGRIIDCKTAARRPAGITPESSCS